MSRSESQERSPNPSLDKAILALLGRLPLQWEVLDPDQLTATEQDALKLLTAGELVERRFSFRLTLIGHPMTMEAVITASGEQGIVQAAEPILAEAWHKWLDEYRKQKGGPEEEQPKFYCQKTAQEMIRLTPRGETARADAAAGNTKVVLDFVFRRTAVFMGLVVPGYGKAESIRWMGSESTPAEVKVTNLSEVSEPLKGMADAITKAFEKLASLMPLAQSPGSSEAQPATAGKEGKREIDWHNVQKSLLRLSRAGEAYTTQADLARRLGCAKSTINKAIHDSSELRAWKRGRTRTSPGVQSADEMFMDTHPASTPDPSDIITDDEVDNVMQELIQQAEPTERSGLNALDQEGRRKIVRIYLNQKQDERRGNRLLDRKP